jgi:hypothetical protein
MARVIEPATAQDRRWAGRASRTGLGLYAAFASACFHPTYDHPACGLHGECPPGLSCEAGVCESWQGVREMRSFDFAGLQAGQLVNLTADVPRASLTPDAYTYGGLAAYGLQGPSLWTRGNNPSWTALAGVVPSGVALWRGEALSSTSNLAYLGITDPTHMTLWFAGEVWLDAGASERFTVTARDFAFVDLALPDTTDYTRLSADSGTVAVPTPVSGWYPIRIGFSSADPGSSFSFTHGDRVSAASTAWTRDRLRARASELRGALRTVFGQVMLGGGANATAGEPAQPPVVSIESGDLMPANTFDVPPPGADSGNDNWSARYVGQFYAAAAGNYTLVVDSDDGNRARLADQRKETSWNGNIRPGTTTLSAALNAGWNDLMVDYEQRIGGRSLHVQLIGPDGTALEIPHDQLRPVESAADRLVCGSDDTTHAIRGAPTAPGTAQIAVAGYPGETVRAIDVAFYVNTSHPDHLAATLVTPDGVQVPLPAFIDTSHASPPNAEVEISPDATGTLAALLGGQANGVWKLIVASTVAGDPDSVLVSAKLALHTSGGPDKVARAASWISPPIDTTTSVVAIDSITWDARTPPGTAVVAIVRACQQADCSEAPAWSEAARDGHPMAEPGRYLQLRVDVTGDGTIESELKSVAIEFRRKPG